MTDEQPTETTDFSEYIERLKSGTMRCQEASILSKEVYIPCGSPANTLVKTRDRTPYFMCEPCSWHNVNNRGATLVARIPVTMLNENTTLLEGLRLLKSESPTETLVLADLAAELMAAKEAKRTAEEAESRANKEIERLEQTLFEQMTLQEIEKFAAHGQLFFPVIQAFPAVNKELEPSFMEWLNERGEAGIYKMTVHPQTLKGFYNLHDEWHEELTEKGFLKVHEKVRIGTRKQ